MLRFLGTWKFIDPKCRKGSVLLQAKVLPSKETKSGSTVWATSVCGLILSQESKRFNGKTMLVVLPFLGIHHTDHRALCIVALYPQNKFISQGGGVKLGNLCSMCGFSAVFVRKSPFRQCHLGGDWWHWKDTLLLVWLVKTSAHTLCDATVELCSICWITCSYRAAIISIASCMGCEWSEYKIFFYGTRLLTYTGVRSVCPARRVHNLHDPELSRCNNLENTLFDCRQWLRKQRAFCKSDVWCRGSIFSGRISHAKKDRIKKLVRLILEAIWRSFVAAFVFRKIGRLSFASSTQWGVYLKRHTVYERTHIHTCLLGVAENVIRLFKVCFMKLKLLDWFMGW